MQFICPKKTNQENNYVLRAYFSILSNSYFELIAQNDDEKHVTYESYKIASTAARKFRIKSWRKSYLSA